MSSIDEPFRMRLSYKTGAFFLHFLRHLSHTSPSHGLFNTKSTAEETWHHLPTAADIGRDAYTELLHVKDLFSTATPLLAELKDGRETRLYHSQNFRDFCRVNRHTWMSGWRVHSIRTNTFAWGLQEPHIGSESASHEAADSWVSTWGRGIRSSTLKHHFGASVPIRLEA